MQKERPSFWSGQGHVPIQRGVSERDATQALRCGLCQGLQGQRMFERHRDKNRQMRKKHGNTLIRSLSKLVRDEEAGKLEEVCAGS
jgi:uncharacterized C2H2 Zn-finger protein